MYQVIYLRHDGSRCLVSLLTTAVIAQDECWRLNDELQVMGIIGRYVWRPDEYGRADLE